MTAEHVLVVDDTKSNRLVATGHLEAAGYVVGEVATGEQALAYLETQEVDLVVLDVRMPGIGGFETCRRIRARPATADLPVLFLTAFGDREATQPAIDAGGDDLLPKPFHHAELLLRVGALIRQRKQAQRLGTQHEQLRHISQLVVHELRGPLASILTNAELLQSAGLAADLGETIDDIVLAVSQMDRTVTDLLDLARADDVGLTARLERFDLRAVAAEVATALRGFGRVRRIKLTPDVGVAEMIADRELVRRILQNLVHNAIKYAPVDSEVTIEAMRQPGVVLVRVFDQGPGVPAAERERIFERYVSKNSTGLGLTMCRLAAAAHGGQIWVEGREPAGAVFCVEIPQPDALISPGASSR